MCAARRGCSTKATRSRGWVLFPLLFRHYFFFLLVLLIAERLVLNLPTIIVDLSELSSGSVNSCSHISSDISCIHVYVFLVNRPFHLKGVFAEYGIPGSQFIFLC